MLRVTPWHAAHRHLEACVNGVKGVNCVDNAGPLVAGACWVVTVVGPCQPALVVGTVPTSLPTRCARRSETPRGAAPGDCST